MAIAAAAAPEIIAAVEGAGAASAGAGAAGAAGAEGAAGAAGAEGAMAGESGGGGFMKQLGKVNALKNGGEDDKGKTDMSSLVPEGQTLEGMSQAESRIANFNLGAGTN